MKASKKPPQDGVERISIPPDPQLLKRHATLRADKMEAQVDALMARLVIPEAWHELLMAFYLTDDGLTAFERESFNLRQSLNRYKNLYLDGDISKAEYERQSRFILGRLAERQPTASPEAQEILPLLNAFPQIWAMLTPGEKRLLLSTLFAGLYFDRHGNLRRALAYEPFDQLLNLPPQGILE